MYRKGVSALIRNKNQEFLLVNLVSFEERYYAIPGGGIEDGETMENAVYREIKEELGLQEKSLELVGYDNIPVCFKFKEIKMNRNGIEYEGSERYFFGFNYIGDENEILLKEDEVRSCKWVSLNALKDYLLFDNQLQETTEKIAVIFR